jgi:hypothetical protein
METLTRLVTDSLVRHGFDRPIDPRRLQWSRWFRCDSPHSLLVVPSKPGIFAIAEEIGANVVRVPSPTNEENIAREGHDFSRAAIPPANTPALAAEGTADGNTKNMAVNRMLAVLRFSEDDDMAFTLDRMFTRINPMRARLSSGRCFLRFVIIEDQDQRRSICSALNQWMLSSAEKASGIPAAFSSSVEISMAGETLAPVDARRHIDNSPAPVAIHSASNKNLHCSPPLPSGF